MYVCTVLLVCAYPCSSLTNVARACNGKSLCYLYLGVSSLLSCAWGWIQGEIPLYTKSRPYQRAMFICSNTRRTRSKKVKILKSLSKWLSNGWIYRSTCGGIILIRYRAYLYVSLHIAVSLPQAPVDCWHRQPSSLDLHGFYVHA